MESTANPVYLLGAVLTLVALVGGACLWLGQLQSRVGSLERRQARLEAIAESVQQVAMTIQGDLKGVVATLANIQAELNRRRDDRKGER